MIGIEKQRHYAMAGQWKTFYLTILITFFIALTLTGCTNGINQKDVKTNLPQLVPDETLSDDEKAQIGLFNFSVITTLDKLRDTGYSEWYYFKEYFPDYEHLNFKNDIKFYLGTPDPFQPSPLFIEYKGKLYLISEGIEGTNIGFFLEPITKTEQAEELAVKFVLLLGCSLVDIDTTMDNGVFIVDATITAPNNNVAVYSYKVYENGLVRLLSKPLETEYCVIF